MNILRIADVANSRTGGMSRVMYFTGDILKAWGHEVEYLFREDMGTKVAPQWRRFNVPCRIPALVSKLIHSGHRYDVVEIHEPSAFLYCFLRKHRHQLPPVVLISYGIERRSHEANLGYLRVKNLPISLKARFSPLTVAIPAAYALRNADHILCANSQDVARAREMGVPDSHITLYHTGASDALLTAGMCDKRNVATAAALLFVGTWYIRKGVMDLIPAVTHFTPESPRRDLYRRRLWLQCRCHLQGLP